MQIFVIRGTCDLESKIAAYSRSENHSSIWYDVVCGWISFWLSVSFQKMLAAAAIRRARFSQRRRGPASQHPSSLYSYPYRTTSYSVTLFKNNVAVSAVPTKPPQNNVAVSTVPTKQPSHGKAQTSPPININGGVNLGCSNEKAIDKRDRKAFDENDFVSPFSISSKHRPTKQQCANHSP